MDEVKPPSATGARTHGQMHTGDINEFQMYQRFRLKLVQMFGSLASALFELGVDPESGKISREDFEQVCSSRLNVLTLTEANLLFSHVTNADVLDCGVGGFASYKDFSITDEEWRFVATRKRNVQQGIDSARLPFQSGPGGSSLGMYHRPMRVENVGEQKRLREVSGEGAASKSEGSPGSSHGANFPWRQRQKPWVGSAFAGLGLPEASRSVLGRFRPCEETFKTAGVATLRKESSRKKQEVIRSAADACRRAGDVSCLAAECPPRRSEMEHPLCEKQIDEWWPYPGQRPSPRPKLPRVAKSPR